MDKFPFDGFGTKLTLIGLRQFPPHSSGSHDNVSSMRKIQVLSVCRGALRAILPFLSSSSCNQKLFGSIHDYPEFVTYFYTD